jgi:hypothetical protein
VVPEIGEEFSGVVLSLPEAVPRKILYPVTPELPLALQDRITSWAPVPESDTACGLAAALSVMLSVAVYELAAEGVNVTSMVHFPPAATELPQVSAISAKSPGLLPPIATLVIFKLVPPVLVRVTV